MDNYIFLFVLLGVLGVVFFVPVWSMIDNKKEIEKQETYDDVSFEPDVVKAELIHKHTDLKYSGGTKTPKCNLVYTLVFKTEFDEIKEYEVLQETFEKSELNSKGLLLTVGDQFFDFGEGEDIEEVSVTESVSDS